MQRAKKKGDVESARKAQKEMKELPTKDPNDPEFRRLYYVRYADDFLLGFAGPRDEAEEIKTRIRTFLRDTLKLEMSEEKTLITHGHTEMARFLGYDINVMMSEDGHRAINGGIGLRVPRE